jgi:hypothetical protein
VPDPIAVAGGSQNPALSPNMTESVPNVGCRWQPAWMQYVLAIVLVLKQLKGAGDLETPYMPDRNLIIDADNARRL